VSEDPSRAAWLPQARSYLRRADPVLARLIDDRPAFDPRAWLAQLPPMDLYGALLFQVTGQLRQAGLSWRKIGTLRDRAERMTDGRLNQEVLSTLPDEQQEVLAIAEKWRPYRSLATSYLFSAAFEPAEAPPVARHRSA
jgi:DNA-3-methyladenine glycosylase II